LLELGYRGRYKFRVYVKVGKYRYKVLIGGVKFKKFCQTDIIMREILVGIYHIVLEMIMEFNRYGGIVDFTTEVGGKSHISIKFRDYDI